MTWRIGEYEIKPIDLVPIIGIATYPQRNEHLVFARFREGKFLSTTDAIIGLYQGAWMFGLIYYFTR